MNIERKDLGGYFGSKCSEQIRIRAISNSGSDQTPDSQDLTSSMAMKYVMELTESDVCGAGKFLKLLCLFVFFFTYHFSFFGPDVQIVKKKKRKRGKVRVFFG